MSISEKFEYLGLYFGRIGLSLVLGVSCSPFLLSAP